jgi:hypothetical protein
MSQSNVLVHPASDGSAMSDPTLNLVEFIFCYPKGFSPSWLEGPAIEPDRHLEQEEFELSSDPPKPGDTRSFHVDNSSWIVVDVQRYQSKGDRPVIAAYTAICTMDGEKPSRNDWNGARPILYAFADAAGLLVNPDPNGSCTWGLTAETKYIPKSELGHKRTDIQWFEPDSYDVQTYRAIALCWCQEAALVA